MTSKNTAVLLSVQPKWCKKIADGSKTVEIRKNKPRIETPFKVYIYCTQEAIRKAGIVPAEKSSAELYAASIAVAIDTGHLTPEDAQWSGKIIGEFVCDEITEIIAYYDEPICDYLFADKSTFADSQVSHLELNSYLNGCGGYAWHISDLKLYANPKSIQDYIRASMPDIAALDEELCGYCSATDYGEHRTSGTPNGYWSCDGRWCADAYAEYVESHDGYVKKAPQSWCYVRI